MFAAILHRTEQGGNTMDLFDDTIETSWLDDMIDDVKKKSKKKKSSTVNS